MRTGVTAVLPRGKLTPADPVFAGWFALNGNGEMTGTTWVEESGQLYGPVMITNTESVGVVRDAVIAWSLERYHADLADTWQLPVVAETSDAWLNDMDGFHVKARHAYAALDGARSGPVAEGNVGGGTGMICYEFKGGTGTASRTVADPSGPYTVGALVQANFGAPRTADDRRRSRRPGDRGRRRPMKSARAGARARTRDRSSSCWRPMRRCCRTSSSASRAAPRWASRAPAAWSSNESGEIFIAFSTANSGAGVASGVPSVKMIPNDRMTPFFEAAAEATEEAIVNALVAAETMTGANDRRAIALPHDRLVALLARYNRLAEH